jgi:acetyl/propionyl-CoA carboxylase alpha subunit
MRRALAEYLVVGIKTTLPFFQWLFDQPELVEGRVHTAYLDEVLATRNGRPFVEADGTDQEIASIAAALHAFLGAEAQEPETFSEGAGRQHWKESARAEGLR